MKSLETPLPLEEGMTGKTSTFEKYFYVSYSEIENYVTYSSKDIQFLLHLLMIYILPYSTPSQPLFVQQKAFQIKQLLVH